MSDDQKWLKRLERERAARRQAELLLEQKSSQLYTVNQQLEAQVAVETSKSYRQEKKFKGLFDSSVDGIVLLDRRGCILEVNDALCRLIGCDEGELVGSHVQKVLREHSGAEGVVRSVLSELEREGYVVFEFLLNSSGGRKVACEVSVHRLEIDQGIIVQGVVRDITERRKAASELEKAIELAIEASEAKSLFLATMSHEIRTPLNAIIGFTDLMVQEDLQETHREYLRLIKKSGGVLLSIINDILDFSKIESRQIELEEIDFNLRDCIEGTLDIHSQTASAKNVELLYEIDQEVPLGMRGDMGRLQQVLLNLVSNALKFTEEGAVVVSVKRMSGEVVEIRVKDTGIGFPGEIAEKLFKPFQQEDASTTRKYGGTGLGLAICRELIETMGGSIQAQSEPGKGSEFIIELPHRLAKLEVVDFDGDLDLKGLEGKRALVVDDNDVNLEFMKARLGKWGMSVLCAFGGSEALEILERGEVFDVIFLDMLMPEMDGQELAGRIVRYLGKRVPPMMLVTSARLSGERDRAKRIGFDSVVYKPVHEREFLREILRILALAKLEETKQEVGGEVDGLSDANQFALLVEDNPINAKLAKLIVERLGVSVHVAHNGEEALDAMRLKSIYDVVLMDMQMPVMDGLEATRRIRSGEAGEGYQGVPIVALTANAQHEDQVKCEEAGMTHYLAKPIDMKKLRGVLEELDLVK